MTKDVYIKPSKAAKVRLLDAIVLCRACVIDTALIGGRHDQLLGFRVTFSDSSWWPTFEEMAQPFRAEDPPVARL